MKTSSSDDYLYHYLIKLLNEVKLVRGGTDLAYTLRNRKFIRNYLKEKQSSRLDYIETTFFDKNGDLNSDSVQDISIIKTLQSL